MNDRFAEIQEHMSSLSEAWDRAERMLKTCSVYTEAAPLAENEGSGGASESVRRFDLILLGPARALRDAGRRTVDALNAGLLARDDPSKVNSALDCIADAHLCCLRAQHECIDSSLRFAGPLVAAFEEEFASDLLEHHYVGFSHLRDCHLEAIKLVVESQSGRKRREMRYREIEERYLGDILTGAQMLLSLRATLIAAKADRILLAEIRENENKISMRQNKLAWALAAVGWVTAVFAIFWV